MTDAADDGPLAARIAERARAAGLTLAEPDAAALARHASAVLHSNPALHLTTITEIGEFVERHLGESFEGAAMLDPGSAGTLVDLGSGNGYPGLPLALARPALRLCLAEASRRKAEFLRRVVAEVAPDRATVLETQVQRPADLEGLGSVRCFTSRAMGGWSKILPRLVPLLADGGQILLWAGAEVDAVARRVVWRRLRIVDRRALPRRDASWVWRFERA